MKARKLFLMLAAGLVVAAAIPGAQAVCNPAKTFTSYDSIGYCYTTITIDPAQYKVVPDPNPAAPTGGAIGRMWQTGNRALANEGACTVASWLVDFGSPTYVIDGALGGQTVNPIPCINTGCAVGQMILVLELTTTDGTGSAFIVTDGNEYPNSGCSNTYLWAYTNGSNWQMTPIPRPAIAAPTPPVGGVLSTTLTNPDLRTADHSNPDISVSPFNGLRLMQAFGTADPGRVAAAWTFTGQTFASPGQVAFPVNCTAAGAGNDVFFAYQPTYDNGQFVGDYVGASTRVKCNGTLANPKGKPIGKGHEKH